jgi:heat shock protein HslJ
MPADRAALALVLLPLAIASGCADPGPEAVEPAAPAWAGPTVGDSIDPANATYAGIYDSPVTLIDGIYEGEPFVEGGASRPRLALVREMRFSGDLDGNGNEEIIVFLEENSGGTGRFGYVAVVPSRREGPATVVTALIGDRVQIRSAIVEGNRVSVRVVQTGPGDAACCPSQLATRRWRYKDGALTEEDAEIEGALSLDELEEREWVLLGFGSPEELPLEKPITLLVDGDRVGGFGGCNRYMGSVKPQQNPGGIEFGPLAGTMMACPQPQMDLERRYLSTLQAPGSFAFRAGRLVVLGVDGEGRMTTLLFEARPIHQPEG